MIRLRIVNPLICRGLRSASYWAMAASPVGQIGECSRANFPCLRGKCSGAGDGRYAVGALRDDVGVGIEDHDAQVVASRTIMGNDDRTSELRISSVKAASRFYMMPRLTATIRASLFVIDSLAGLHRALAPARCCFNQPGLPIRLASLCR